MVFGGVYGSCELTSMKILHHFRIHKHDESKTHLSSQQLIEKRIIPSQISQEG